MKKRALSLILVTMLAGSILTGCGAKKQESNKKVITYAAWNLGTEQEKNIERRMVEEFNNSHKDIEVKIDETIDAKDWTGSLTTAAASGKLPDVFMLPSITLGLSNDWLYDITPLVKDDVEWSKMANPVIESTKYNDKNYAIPSGQYLGGYFINKDLFEKENIKVPELGFSLEEFENAIKSTTSANKGILGLAEEPQIVDWYPAAKNENFGMFSWDGEKYNLSSKDFTDGVKEAASFYKGGFVYDGLNEDQKAKFKGTTFDEVWKNGQIALRYDGTWQAKEWGNLNFNTEFVGVPGGRNVIINDYLGLSKSTENTEAAMEFTKWMTYSKEGILKRIDIAKNEDKELMSLPLINDEEVLNEYFDYITIPGVQEAYENIDNGIVEPLKIVPGYIQSRWDALTGAKVGDKENAKLADLIWEAHRGSMNIDDYANQIDKLANDKFEEADSSINK